MKIKLKRSNQLVDGSAKQPPLDSMEYGELAVNFNSADPSIFVRASDGAGTDEIIKIAGVSTDDGGVGTTTLIADGTDGAPETADYDAGTLWFNSAETDGGLYILYQDADPAAGKKWIQIASNVTGGGDGGSGPTLNSTDDLAEGTTNLYFPEADQDGKLYGRQNGAWAEVVIPDAPDVPNTTDDLTEGSTNLYWKEAPTDGKQYARQLSQWREVVATGGEDLDIVPKVRALFTATAGQTEFTLTGDDEFTSGTEQVFLNGALLDVRTEYTTDDSNKVTLTQPALEGDIVEIYCINALPTDDITYTYPTGVEQSLQDRLQQYVSVVDFGADPTGVNRSDSSIQAAIDAQIGPVYFPPGKYRCDEPIFVRNTTKLLGCTEGPPATAEALHRNGSMITFSFQNQNYEACFTLHPDDNPPTSNITFENLAINAEVSGAGFAYNWIFKFPNLASSTFNNVKAENKITKELADAQVADGKEVGVLLAYNDPNITGPYWINRFLSCNFGLADNVNGYVIDHDFSDSFFSQLYLTGGKGSIDRGTGGNLYTGCHFDRAFSATADKYAAFTVTRHRSHKTSGSTSKTFVGCYMDVNDVGFRVDSTDNTEEHDLYWHVIVTGCLFRNEQNGVDIQLVSNPIYRSRGCNFTGNTFSGNNVTSFELGDKWSQVQLSNNVDVTNTEDITASGTYQTKEYLYFNGYTIRGTDSKTYRGQSNVAATFGSTTIGNHLILGSITGNTPFVGAGLNSDGDPSNLCFVRNNQIEFRIEENIFTGFGNNTHDIGKPNNRLRRVYTNEVVLQDKNNSGDSYIITIENGVLTTTKV